METAPTRTTNDEAMQQYLLLRELQLKEQVEALARLPEVPVKTAVSQADDTRINLFDVLEDDDFFDEHLAAVPGSPARSDLSMASSTSTARLEGSVPSQPLVVDDALDSETGVTQWLNTAFKCAAACSSRTLTTQVPAHLLRRLLSLTSARLSLLSQVVRGARAARGAAAHGGQGEACPPAEVWQQEAATGRAGG